MMNRRQFLVSSSATGAFALSGCAQDPTGNTAATIVGGIAAGGVADALGANENVTAVAAILGGIAGQSINRSSTGGCISTGTTSPVFRGGHVFYNPRMGVIQCPAGSIRNNKVVEGLYNDPNWQPIVSSNSGGRRGYGRGPVISPFGFMEGVDAPALLTKNELSKEIAKKSELIDTISEIYNVKPEVIIKAMTADVVVLDKQRTYDIK